MRSSLTVIGLMALAAPSIVAQPQQFIIYGVSTQKAGQSQLLRIVADSAGLPATSYSGPKTLLFSGANPSPDPVTAPTATDSGGVPVEFGSGTILVFEGGVASATDTRNGAMTLYRAESAAISVTDGVISSSPSGNLLVGVEHGDLARFTLALSTPQSNGTAFAGTNTLTALDSWGNPVTAFDAAADPVRISVGGGGAVSGLGSSALDTLNLSGEFALGVSNLTGKLIYTGQAGEVTFTATSSSARTGSSAPITILAGNPSTVRVETEAGGNGSPVPDREIASGTALTVYSIARDVSGNFAGNIAATWRVQDSTGGVRSSDLTPASDGGSATFTGGRTGTGRVSALADPLTPVPSGLLTVIPGPESRITLETAADGLGQVVPPETLVSGDARTLFAISRDAAGNYIGNYSASYGLINVTGGVDSSDLVPSADGRSATFMADKVGSAEILPARETLSAVPTGPIVVVAAAATRLVITGNSDQVAGSRQDLTITARDGAGNIDQGYKGNHNLRFSGADSSLDPKVAPTVSDRNGIQRAFGVTTSISFTSGRSVVSGSSNGAMRLYSADLDTIAVTDGSIGSTGNDRLIVNVSPAALNKFALSLTTPQLHAVPFTGINTLAARDAYGNQLLSYDAASNPITVTSTLPGTVSGLGTTPNVLSSAADFTGGLANLTGRLTYTGTAGTGTFTARAATGESGTSGAVTIVAPSAGRLRITGNSTQVAGQGQNLTITALDADGGTAVSYSGVKALVFQQSPAVTEPLFTPTVSDTAGKPVAFGLQTEIAFVSGVATVTGSRNGVLRLFKVGTDTISVTDGTIAAFGNDRLIVTVSNAPIAKFRVRLSTPQTNGADFTGLNAVTALDDYDNIVINFDAGVDNVRITSSLTGTVSGLGSLGNNVLNQTSDFLNGVANLTGKIRFSGLGGRSVFTALSVQSARSGVSDSVLINNPSPTIVSVSPDTVNRTSTAKLTIAGSNFFRGVTGVNPGAGILVDSLRVVSSAILELFATVAPGAATGARDLVVSNSGPGGGTATLPLGLTVKNVPHLVSLNPPGGVRGATLDVTLTGTNFEDGVSTVGIFPPTILLNSQTVSSPTTIVANVTIPSGASNGTRVFTVSNSGPYGGVSNGIGFTVGDNPSPTVTSVVPGSGTRRGTVDLTVTGTEFYGGVTSLDPGPGISVTSLTVDSTTRLRATIVISDTALTGPRAMSVVNAPPGGGTGTLQNAFVVLNPVPAITGISPQTAARLETRVVSVTGGGFIGGVTSLVFGPGISVGGVSVTGPAALTASITVDSTAPTGIRDVIVTNALPGGGSDTLQAAFTVTAPSSILSEVFPDTVSLGSPALQLTARGSKFAPESIVRLDTLNLATTFISTTELRAVVPAQAMDTARVYAATVFSASTGYSTSRSFTVINPVPGLVSITPDTASRAQTLEINVNGSGFVPGKSTVVITPPENILVDSVRVLSGGSLRAYVTVALAAAEGRRSFAVHNPEPGGGTSATLPFTVAGNPLPVLTGLQPAAGARLQTLDVVLTGSNFIAGVSTANFGAGITVGTSSLTPERNLKVSITISVSAATGSRSVTVTNPAPGGGTSQSLQFQVNNPAPLITGVSPANAALLQTLDISIRGRNFIDAVTALSISGRIVINSFAVLSDSVITANVTIPSDATYGPRDITVVNSPPGGGSAVLSGGFIIGLNPLPVISGVSPSTVTRLSTTVLTVTGESFLGGVTTIQAGAGITVLSVQVDSTSRMTVTVAVSDNAATGPRDLVVVNGPPGGGQDTLQAALTVVNPVPVLAAVFPFSAELGQTLNVVMRGRGFIGGVTSPSMGPSIAVNSFTVNADSQLTAGITVGSSAQTGQRTISVINTSPGGGSSNTVSFTINAPSVAPLLVFPPEGATGVPPSPTLVWRLRTGATRYHAQVSADSTFSLVVAQDTAVTDTIWLPGPLQADTRLFWRVRARFSTAYGPFSETRSFRTGEAYPSTYTLNATIPFPSKEKASDYLASEYKLVGLPGSSGDHVTDLLTGTNDVDWQVYWDNGAPTAAEGFVKYDATDTFRFLTGRAFWMIRKGNITIARSVPTATLETAQVVNIPLHNGWNLITNPFLAPVSWGAVQSLNGTSELLFGYAGGFTNPASLEPYAGYYFFNSSNLASLRIPVYSGASGAPPEGLSKSAAEGGWEVGIDLVSGSYHEKTARFGIRPGAHRALDAADARRPRSFGNLPGVSFMRPDWDSLYSSFARDIRADVHEPELWDFEVTSPGRSPVTLQFTGVDWVPPEYAVFLVDVDRARTVNLRENREYAFVPARERSGFAALVGPESSVQQKLSEYLPTEFSLGANFPNPFNPQTTIPVSVPRKAALTLQVYNLLGAEVRLLHQGVLEPGRYWFLWDGRDGVGAAVASGMYLYRLVTDGGVQVTHKMILLK